MKRYAYLSSKPTPVQSNLALQQNIELIPVGDISFEDLTVELIDNHPLAPFDGVIVTNSLSALLLTDYYPVGIFDVKIRDKGTLSQPVTSLYIF